MSHQRVLRVLRKHKTFVISTHVNPDPDALASELAMAAYLRSLGKTVVVLNAEPVPGRYSFLPGTAGIKNLKAFRPVLFDAAVVVDCGDLDRVGKVKDIVTATGCVINIDHHITNDGFGHVNLVRPKASSTAEVIYDLLGEARVRLSKSMATLIYVGILTDTGSFRYENTTAHTHEVAGDLVKFGLPVSRLYQQIYETVSLNDLSHFTKVVNRAEPLWDGKVMVLELRRSQLTKFSPEIDLRDNIFRYLRAIKGLEVIVILTEQGKGEVRANFRSQRTVDVAKLASVFGGGGHARASGCAISGGLRTARAKVLAELKKVL